MSDVWKEIFGGGFQPDKVETDEFQPIPPGWYPALIEDAEVSANKANTGHYLKVTFRIIGAAHAGRKMFEYLNIKHANETAERIGQQGLAALSTACNLNLVTDSSEFIDKVVEIQIKLSPDKEDDTKMVNNIVTYRKPTGVTPQTELPAQKPRELRKVHGAHDSTKKTREKTEGDKKFPWEE